MNRLRTLVRSDERRKFLVPFLTAGYPNLKLSLDLVKASVDSGADMVEIGIPFSDPVADGPAIQYSSQIALSHGITLTGILRFVEQLRKSIEIPIVLMGYYNPLIAFGLEKFLKVASSAGVDGLIIPDLPVDEGKEISSLAHRYDISPIFLVAPTSGSKRIRMIDNLSSDLVYAVTVTGVTGSRTGVAAETEKYLKMLRSRLSRPFVAGFGVSSSASALRLARYSDGVVIGSALIDILRHTKNQRTGLKNVTNLLGEIRSAIGT